MKRVCLLVRVWRVKMVMTDEEGESKYGKGERVNFKGKEDARRGAGWMFRNS